MDRLAEYLATLGAFNWATFNCCHYVAGWLVMNGEPDPMRGFPATPSLRAARRLVREHGGIINLVSKQLGRSSIATALAQVGDIVHFQLDGSGFTLGICNGRESICIDERGFVAFVPTLGGSCAWRLKA